jgi:CSLREA domain-containing protein
MNTTTLRSTLGLLLGAALLLALAPAASAQTVFVNEIHYDNTGADQGEFVEVAGPAGTDLTDWTIRLYTGSNGTPYGSIPLSGTIDDEGDGFGALAFYEEGIQNGAPDGLVLVNADGSVVQFLSYEGSFTADGGQADGMTSEDIGVDEQPATDVGNSIQLKGTGTAYDDFAWTEPSPESPGSVNNGQSFASGGGGTPGMIVVTTAEDETNDDGDCSLREAVQAANTNAAVDGCAAGDADGDVITFDMAYTIELSLGELPLSDDVSIDGSGVGGVMVDANGTSRIFDVDAAGGPGDDQAVSFVSLMLREGDSSAGGSDAPDAGGAVDLKAGSEALFLDTDVLDSVAGINGGGIHGAGNTLIQIMTTDGGSSTISGNEAQGGDAGMGGGGVWGAGATMISGNVLIDGNAATGASGSGGGVFNFGGTLEMTGVTVSNNTANRAGGGVEDFGDDDADTDVTLTDVTLSGNSISTPAPGNGGGLHSGGGDVVVTGGSVTGNTAVEGGGLWASGTMTVSGGTLIDGNTATSDDDAAFEGGGGVFNQAGAVTIDGATISNNTALGTAGSGGGAFTNGDGTLTVSNSTFSGNASLWAGGGIEVNGGTVMLTGVDFDQNATGGAPGNGGALHVTAGTVTATGGEVTGNTAASEGGGFWNNAGWTMTVDGTLFSGNEARGAAADNGGGALFNNGGTLIVMDATIDDNAATGTSGSGGGVFNGGVLQITESTVSNNRANRAGGGIEDAGGIVVLENVTVSDNSIDVAAPGNGGGLHSGGGDVTVNGGSFTGNSAVEGGGLWTNGTLAVTTGEGAATISGNTATGDAATNGGGGLYAESGASVTVAEATITDNAATGAAGSGGGVFVADGASVTVALGEVSLNRANRAGGGIEVADDATTEDATVLLLGGVTVRSNAIDTPAPGNGGGLQIGGAGSAEVEGSTFAGNTAVEGAGLWVSAAGRLRLSLSTVSNNEATADGGGVYDDGPGGSIVLASVTVADNSASGNGGGLLSQSADDDSFSFSFTNTIVGANVAAGTGDDCFGTFDSGDYNLVGDTAGCVLTGDTDNNVTSQDPMLEGLADNGGPTLTRALMAGSPAVDAGMTEFDVDQRGFARADGQDDIGAFERGAVDVGDAVACSASAPVFFSDFDPDGDDPTFGEFAAISNDSEEDETVNLSTCSFVVFSAQTERVTYSARTEGSVEASETFVLATMDGDQTLPEMTLPDGPGAFALITGTAETGDTVGEVADRVVAAVVYRDEDDVFGRVRGGDGGDNAAELRAALEALARAVPNEDDGEVDLTLAAVPNPVSNRGTIAFGVAAAADVRVSVYDALGREVAVLAEGPYGVGRYALSFEAGSLPSGVYVIRAVVGTEARTARVTVVR